jgi:hypothetical protein
LLLTAPNPHADAADQDQEGSDQAADNWDSSRRQDLTLDA